MRASGGLSLIILAATIVFSAVLFIHRDEPRFDTNLSHINYMTPQQRADFAHFEQLSTVHAEQSSEGKNCQLPTAYTASTAKAELARRLELWNNWWSDKDRDKILADFRLAAAAEGFTPEAFRPFEENISKTYSQTAELAKCFPGRVDTAAMNSRVAGNLSDNFDYLGLVCSAIVFIFLCLTFRSIRLAVIAFLPMAVSWLWILGIMDIIGLQFNIVNIILATFLFGQGDDYTIFVLEGALYERRTGKKMLPQYRQSILLSALIMLIGIGVLLIARHPAMHSLGAVTMIGMTCVVFMAWVLPPALLQLSKHNRSIP